MSSAFKRAFNSLDKEIKSKYDDWKGWYDDEKTWIYYGDYFLKLV